MATAPQTKLTKEERKILTNGLDMLSSSLKRSAKAAKGMTIREAFETEAAAVDRLTAKLNTGELDL